ncbi:DUF294 nucleotidyltransferase-like domain-containing protein [Halovulum sp. GXIMD14794]
MPEDSPSIAEGLMRHAPFDQLPDEARTRLAGSVESVTCAAGEVLFDKGGELEGLYVIESGIVHSEAAGGEVVSRRGPGDILGERGLLRDGKAQLTARVIEPARLWLVPAASFRELVRTVPVFSEWFGRPKAEDSGPYATGLTALRVEDLMATEPVSCSPDASITKVARIMRDRGINSVLVMEGNQIRGIVTARDLTGKVLAEGRDGTVLVSEIMTPGPITIPPEALGIDALVTLADHGISHLPVEQGGRIVGMIGKTDLFRRQAATASYMIAEIVEAESAEDMAAVVARTPALLAQLVAAGVRHDAISRRITDITDAVTRRLLTLAEARLGPPPVPYLWLACGSQGRREQTGVSDQDNCLILDDAVAEDDDAYFAALAQFVSDGLNTCGFVYCPGDMMATVPRWRQPRRVWREYFAGWIAQPDNEAQMLASVMFDLRPISGAMGRFDELQEETLAMARRNSIFVAHMISNSLKHTPPLSLFRGFALIRSGEHKNTVDLKHSGVVPVVDLGRVYALQAGITSAGTRDRLKAAGEAGLISAAGAADLLDAFDLIAQTRLQHQAAQVRKNKTPDNFMSPATLSELERNHLRDAFMVVKTMQSALGSGKQMLG